MRIVVVGGSFGGLTAAFTLRQRLGAGRHEIILVSKEGRFTFIPSLPWVAMGWRKMADISFDLAPVLARWKVGFVEAAITRIDPATKQVHTAAETLDYDYLVIAAGHRSANEAVPGLGPFDGPGHSLMSPPCPRSGPTSSAPSIRWSTPIPRTCCRPTSAPGKPGIDPGQSVDYLTE